MVTHLQYCMWRDISAVSSLSPEDRQFLDSLEACVTFDHEQQARLNALWDHHIGPTAKL